MGGFYLFGFEEGKRRKGNKMVRQSQVRVKRRGQRSPKRKEQNKMGQERRS